MPPRGGTPVPPPATFFLLVPWSVFGEWRLPIDCLDNSVSVIGRYDQTDPELQRSSDRVRFVIIGTSYRASERVICVLDHQVTILDAPSMKRADRKMISRDGRTYFHLILFF
jgi:hypothetical protein